MGDDEHIISTRTVNCQYAVHDKLAPVRGHMNDPLKSSRPRGRPRRTEQAESQMRMRILEAASTLFREHGYEGVSMRRIAADANCGAMTIYEYFPSKIDVLRHLWSGFFDEVFREVERAASARKGLRAVENAAKAYLDYWFKHPDRFRMVFLNEDRSERGEPLFVEIAEVVGRMQPIVEAIVQGQARGEIVEGDPALLLQTLLCLVNGIALNLITIGEMKWKPRAALLRVALQFAAPRN